MYESTDWTQVMHLIFALLMRRSERMVTLLSIYAVGSSFYSSPVGLLVYKLITRYHKYGVVADLHASALR